MSAPFPLPDLATLFHPLGASSPFATDVPCRCVPNLKGGRGASSGPTYLIWTHYIDFDPGSGLQDGCTRASGTDYVTYNDGDGITVVTAGVALFFVVVWVEDRYTNTPKAYQRVYCLRDQRVV